MGVLDDLSGALQGAVDWTFGDATLDTGDGAYVSNDRGGFTQGPSTHACRAKVDYKRGVDAAGGSIVITRILILKGELTVEPAEGNTIVIGGTTYRLQAPKRDGLGSHWICEVQNG